MVFSVPLFVFPPSTSHRRFATISNSRAGVEIGAELRERFRHVFAAIAEANVARLIVDGSRQEQNSRVFHHVLAKRSNVALGLEVREADGTGVGLDPLEEARMPPKERVEKGQVAKDDIAIALDQGFTMAQSHGGEKLAGGAAANRGVVLEFEAAMKNFRVFGSKPTEPKAG